MPGMIAAHGHVTFASPLVKMLIGQDANKQAIRSALRAHGYLMAGFTTVRDMGGNSFGLQKALDAGMFDGPWVLQARHPLMIAIDNQYPQQQITGFNNRS